MVKSFYTVFAVCMFALFFFLQWRGVSLDRSQRIPDPQYYSYRGGTAVGGYFGTSSRSSYSHK